MEVAIDGLMWYKLYSEHHYWSLWVDAVEANGDSCSTSNKEECAIEDYDSYVIEV